jgi:hypothetical protein
VVVSELTQVEKPAESLELEAREVLGRLQESLARLLAQLPEDVKRPMDLQHVLGQDYKVCWQVFQFVRADNPLAACHHVPSRVLMRKLTAAAGERGVSAETVAAVDDAVQALTEMAQAHAEDRASFDAMLTTLSGEPAESLAVQHRRKAFRSESLLWGVQIGVLLVQYFARVSPDGLFHNECYITTKHEIRRSRPAVMPLLHGFRPHSGDEVLPNTGPVALDAAAVEKYGAPLLEAFCTQPLPKLLSLPVSDGWTYTVLDSRELGRRGAATMAFGGITRSPRVLEDGKIASASLNVQITMPTELVILEMFLHRPTFGERGPEYESTMMMPGIGPGIQELPGALRQALRIEQRAEVESLGSAKEMAPLVKFPKHEAMTAYAFKQLGWDAGEFGVWRVQVPFPMLHSEFELRATAR